MKKHKYQSDKSLMNLELIRRKNTMRKSNMGYSVENLSSYTNVGYGYVVSLDNLANSANFANNLGSGSLNNFNNNNNNINSLVNSLPIPVQSARDKSSKDNSPRDKTPRDNSPRDKINQPSNAVIGVSSPRDIGTNNI